MNPIVVVDVAIQEARRRAKRRNPPIHYVVEALRDLGYKLVAT